MHDESSNQQEIFLNDGSICMWERPGLISLAHYYAASTKLIEPIGIDFLNEEVFPYIISASTTKYLADIAPANLRNFLETVQLDPKRMVLFDGVIGIYKNGLIPGTELQGYTLKKHGMIWIAKENIGPYKGSDGLRNIIFENSPDKISRVEAIIRGFEAQEQAKDEADTATRRRIFENGRQRGEVDSIGFGL